MEEKYIIQAEFVDGNDYYLSCSGESFNYSLCHTAKPKDQRVFLCYVPRVVQFAVDNGFTNLNVRMIN